MYIGHRRWGKGSGPLIPKEASYAREINLVLGCRNLTATRVIKRRTNKWMACILSSIARHPFTVVNSTTAKLHRLL